MTKGLRALSGACIAGALALGLVAPVGAIVAPEPAPIGAHQSFQASVNRKDDNAIVNVMCGNRITGFGKAGPNQSLAIRRVASKPGEVLPNTGSGRKVFVYLEGDATKTPIAVFTSYKTKVLRKSLPCSGTGTLKFTTCKATRVCLADSVADRVTVRFVSGIGTTQN